MVKCIEGFTPLHFDGTHEDMQGNDGFGRIIFIPGSDGRAKEIADYFTNRGAKINMNRHHNLYLGELVVNGKKIEVGAISTGMGCPSVEIIVNELLALGAQNLIRLGTAGTMNSKYVPAGSLVISLAAVKNEGATKAYVPIEFPAIAHPDVVLALQRAAFATGLEDKTYRGITHVKDALYGMEHIHPQIKNPMKKEDDRYMEILKAAGCVASSMEESIIYTLACINSSEHHALSHQSCPGDKIIRAGSLLAIIGDEERGFHPDIIKNTEKNVIKVGLRAAYELIQILSAVKGQHF